MANIYLFLSIAFLLIFLLGNLLEKIRVPWIFSALLIGALLAAKNPFASITSSDIFDFLSQLGMYFLLFMIGFEVNIHKLNKLGGFIIKSTFSIIFLEGFFGALVIHFVFGYEWLISFVIALSFATVGEAILIPILDEFKIINTKLGQSIISIGTLDDLIELVLLILVIFLTGSSIQQHINIFLVVSMLFVLFALTFLTKELKTRGKQFCIIPIEMLFLFALFIFFLYLGIGEYAQSTAIAALLAGIAIKTFFPQGRLKKIESEIKTMCYGFFAPIFFLWIGININMQYLIKAPLLILLVVAVSNGTKLLGSYFLAKKELGVKGSVLLGIGLSVRFSTSLIIIKILFDNGLITSELYSIIIASSIIFTFVVPIIFSNLLVKWGFVVKK